MKKLILTLLILPTFGMKANIAMSAGDTDEINYGKTIFYDFYAEHQKSEAPAKASTGLFFFRGRPGAPFVMVCPGGGFSYVGSLHEGFPLAMVLSQKGYNTFVLKT